MSLLLQRIWQSTKNASACGQRIPCSPSLISIYPLANSVRSVYINIMNYCGTPLAEKSDVMQIKHNAIKEAAHIFRWMSKFSTMAEIQIQYEWTMRNNRCYMLKVEGTYWYYSRYNLHSTMFICHIPRKLQIKRTFSVGPLLFFSPLWVSLCSLLRISKLPFKSIALFLTDWAVFQPDLIDLDMFLLGFYLFSPQQFKLEADSLCSHLICLKFVMTS